MAVKKISKPALTRSVIKIKDPGRVFYRPAVDDVLKRGDFGEIQATLKGARDAQAKFGDFNGLINALEAAARKAQVK